MVHIVYPYKIPQDKRFGWELKYSLRSLEKNFKEDFDVTIIGEIPDWIDTTKVTCVLFDNDHLDCQRQSKINQKILKASEFFEEFIVFNDDIYLMKETSLQDLKIPRRIQDLDFDFRVPKQPKSFKAQLRNSYYVLKDLGKQHKKNFVSHCPHFYKTGNIKEIQKFIDLAPISYPSVLFENIYFNFIGESGKSATGFRYGCWRENCKEYSGEQIFNHNENGSIKNQFIEEFLSNEFKEKSRFEK